MSDDHIDDDVDDLPPPSGAPARMDPPPPVVAWSEREDVRGHCEICGRHPAYPVHARKYTGLILIGRTTFWKGLACRDCGVALYRDGVTHCLAAGWWGIIPLVVNPVRLLQNVRGLRDIEGRRKPRGVTAATPMETGDPVLRRPSAWIGIAFPVALLVVLTVLLWPAGTPAEVPELATGRCLNLPADGSFTELTGVSCTGPHSAVVTGIRDGNGAADGAGLCQAEAAEFLGDSQPSDDVVPAGLRMTGEADRVVCLIVSVDGGKLSGPASAAGG